MFKKISTFSSLVFTLFLLLSFWAQVPSRAFAMVDGVWMNVGSAGFSTSVVSYTSIALDSNNMEYVLFQDGANGNKATVMKFNGTTWETVGSAGFSAGSISLLGSIVLDSNDVPYVAYIDSANGDKATVMKFNGTSWETVGSAGFSAGGTLLSSMVLDSNDLPYVVYADSANGNKATVMKFNGTTWNVVGVAGFSAGWVDVPLIVLDSNNLPYVAYTDRANGDKATVMKFNGTTWSVVGVAGFSAGGTTLSSMVIDSNNVPYVAYRDYVNGNKATVMKFNGTTWETVGSAGFSVGSTNRVSMVLDSNNLPYVAFKNGDSGDKATVMKFNGTTWETVGSAGFSMDMVSSINIALNSSNNPSVAYQDYSKGNKATVMKFITDPIIYKYLENFKEAYNFPGLVEGSKIFYLANDTFINRGSILTEGIHYNVTNLPAGLTPIMTIDSAGETATLTFTGVAIDNDKEDLVNNLTITFLDGAFTNTAMSSEVLGHINSGGKVSFFSTFFNGTTILYGSDGAGNNSNINLYRLDPGTGSILATIGSTGHNINGMSLNPVDGKLYGNTSSGDSDGANPKSLFTINTETGLATLLGVIKDENDIALSFADIAFRSNGTLYGRTTSEENNIYLYTIDTICPSNTCRATPVSAVTIGQGAGGGIAFDSQDNLYVFENEEAGYYKINPDTGSILESHSYENISENDAVITSAKFDGNNILFANRTNWGRSPADLVTIDTASGNIISTGENNPDMVYMTALAFKLTQAVDPTCSDGILNQDETGIDVGGVCTQTPVTPTCSDGILNQDETEVDIGGVCSPVPAPQIKRTSSGSKPGNFKIQNSVITTPVVTQAQIFIANILKRGIKGNEVNTLQTYLSIHGYEVGIPDGFFGPKTESAIKKFQSDNGLTPDGIVGPNTVAKMNGSMLVNANVPSLANTSTTSPTVLIDKNLKQGIKLDDIKLIQTYLSTHGYELGTPDGFLGPKTKSAIIKFQSDNNLTPDGIVGPQTKEAMK